MKEPRKGLFYWVNIIYYGKQYDTWLGRMGSFLLLPYPLAGW